MRTICIVLLLVLMAVPSVYGITAPSSEVKVLDISPMPEVTTISDLSLEIEFDIENTGYEKVLISLPSEFTVHTDNIDAAQGEAVITNRLALIDKYGDPDDITSFRNMHFVMTSTTPISRGASMNYSELGETRRGWYIRPNELLKGHIKVAASGTTGVIDPFALEVDLPIIEVTRFNAIIRFEPLVNTYGFVTAPYVVKDATLISSYPSIFADGNDFDESEYYWETFKLPETKETSEINVVDWDDWFPTTSLSLITSSVPLTPNLLAATDLEYYPIEKVEKISDDDEVFVPVWYIKSDTGFVRYDYEWRKNFPVSGVNLEYLTEPPRVAAVIPEWNDWF